MTKENPASMTEHSAIINALGVSPHFDAAQEARRRIDFLATYLRASGLGAYVLGISGGVDSLAAALLAQRAVEELRNAGYDAKFLAVRLPYWAQADEADAQRALETIGADGVRRIDIKPAADAMLASIKLAGVDLGDAGREDFSLGNIKARQRMIAQFALAGANRGMVIGTDHASEALMGFFTKFGDGAADILPLAGLNKRRVRALAAHLGAPAELVGKIPTADLENLVPLRPDEDAYGVTYDQIDDFLEGQMIDEAARARILHIHASSAHKRALPVAPPEVHKSATELSRSVVVERIEKRLSVERSRLMGRNQSLRKVFRFRRCWVKIETRAGQIEYLLQKRNLLLVENSQTSNSSNDGHRSL